MTAAAITDVDFFDLGDFVLQCGQTLRGARLAYKTHGHLNADKSNAVVYPTRFGGTHLDNEFLIGAGMALDPAKYFIVVPNLFGAGVSSSPSNTPPPQNAARFPPVTYYDNVTAQRRLLAKVFGVRKIALAIGWSMGAQQAYLWACLYPDDVARLAPLAGSARTSRHNYVFLEGVKTALITDPEWRRGWYRHPPQAGLRAMGRVWAGWALSQAFYRREEYIKMGYSSLEDFLVSYWEAIYLARDANDILAMIDTWQRGDISNNPAHGGDYEKAMKSIKAKTIIMPGATDLYFPPEDSALEADLIPSAELRPIPSDWGHYAAGGKDPKDTAFINAALKELLAR